MKTSKTALICIPEEKRGRPKTTRRTVEAGIMRYAPQLWPDCQADRRPTALISAL